NLVMNAIEAMHSVHPRVLKVQTEQSDRVLCVCRSKTAVQVLIEPISIRFSSRYSRQRRGGWEWAYPSPSRSLKATTDRFGYRLGRTGGRFSTLNCRPGLTKARKEQTQLRPVPLFFSWQWS